jgi:hypothetical protein
VVLSRPPLTYFSKASVSREVDTEGTSTGGKSTSQADKSTWQDRFARGGSFILDAPKQVPAVWGDGEQVAWSEGEPLLLVGPEGVGKTTLAGQLVMARLGLLTTVLGIPVTPGQGRLLYLACDRPAQVQRSLARLVDEADRELLDERLAFWKGPPPADFGTTRRPCSRCARPLVRTPWWSTRSTPISAQRFGP